MKCPKCKNKMTLFTDGDEGETGYAFKCTDCTFEMFSEITNYIGYRYNSEHDRRKVLEEFEVQEMQAQNDIANK